MKSGSKNKTTTRTYGGLSDAERKIERRERFLEAGLEVFGTVGLRGATVRALCKAAGLTERYFYESFAETEALFCAVYEQQLEVIRDLFATEIPRMPTDLNERTRACLKLFFTAMRNDRIVRVLHVESMAGSQRVSSMHHTNLRAFADFAAHLIRFDNPGLNISHELASALGLALNGACISTAVEWMLDKYVVPEDILIDSCTMLILGTMREVLAMDATAELALEE